MQASGWSPALEENLVIGQRRREIGVGGGSTIYVCEPSSRWWGTLPGLLNPVMDRPKWVHSDAKFEEVITQHVDFKSLMQI